MWPSFALNVPSILYEWVEKLLDSFRKCTSNGVNVERVDCEWFISMLPSSCKPITTLIFVSFPFLSLSILLFP